MVLPRIRHPCGVFLLVLEWLVPGDGCLPEAGGDLGWEGSLNIPFLPFGLSSPFSSPDLVLMGNDGNVGKKTNLFHIKFKKFYLKNKEIGTGLEK